MEALRSAAAARLAALGERERRERAAGENCLLGACSVTAPQQGAGTPVSTDHEVLEKLQIPLSSLPQKCRNLLKQATDLQLALEIQNLEPVTVSLQYTNLALQEIDDEYEILKLKQKNEELDDRIQENREEILEFRKQLENAKNSLRSRIPNPETIADEINIMRQKVVSYEHSYEKTKTKFTNLNVPGELHPKALDNLINQLVTLRAEEMDLKDKADHITLARSAKQKLLQLKGAKF